MFLLDMLSNMHPIPPATCNKHTCAGNRAEMNIAESNDKFDLEKLVMVKFLFSEILLYSHSP